MKRPPIAPPAVGTDPYGWLAQRDSPEVLNYLHAENTYLTEQLGDTLDWQECFFQEIKGRIRETDLSLPEPRGAYLYYQRTATGAEYPRYYRCPRAEELIIDESRETLLLDPNALANDGFLALGCLEISPDHRLLAYSLDTSGDETYQLFVKDLESQRTSRIPFAHSDGSLIWANDNRTLFLIERDEAYRPFRLHRHRLDTQVTVPVMTEKDDRFFLSCYRTSSEQYIVILLASKTTTEAWLMNADDPQQTPLRFSQRRDGHEYYPDHGTWAGTDQWFIRSNREGINYALYQATDDALDESAWAEIVPYDPHRTLEGIALKRDTLILAWREDGLPTVEVRQAEQPGYQVRLPDQAYSLDIQDDLEFESPVIRLRYEALNRPAQIRQLTLADGQQKTLKQIAVEGPFDADDYISERLWATAADGTRIPITYVAHRNTAKRMVDHPAPLYLYGYGAYGESLDPWFSHARLSLLERGWVFAIAHVRGGGDLGENWYRQGKLEYKTNTFTDFIACAEHLLSRRMTSESLLAIGGASAGGLLIGAVLNQRPDLFGAAIADVPFVDVLNTMLNPELPLTVTEYDEWGDPHEPSVRARLKAYSPYENVSAQAYPALLITAGYHDSRVAYWEAAKWAAKLRAYKTDHNLLLLKTEFDAGHGGKSGRYQAWRDVALEYAFLFKVLGLPLNPRREPQT